MARRRVNQMANGKYGNGSKKREFTAQRIIKALHETHGLQTLAAQKAGIGYRTLCRYVAEFPSVAEALVDSKEEMLDFAEGKLYQKIRADDNTAIIFYLKTQGKSRGYIERQEVTGREGIPVTPAIMNFHFADGTVIKPPRNGHEHERIEIGGNGNKASN